METVITEVASLVSEEETETYTSTSTNSEPLNNELVNTTCRFVLIFLLFFSVWFICKQFYRLLKIFF